MQENRMKLTFFDEYWVDFRPGTVRRWHTPELFSQVQTGGLYGALVYDPQLKKYRLYYETLIVPEKDGPRLMKMRESEDLVNWTQVLNDEGGDVLFDGDGGLHGCSVIYDPHDPDPSRRYKFCGMTRMDREGNHPVHLAFSADGVHWESHPELEANHFTSDAHNKLYYNPCSGEYNLLHRSAFVDRRVFLRSSRDLKTWSEPRVLLHPAGIYSDGYTSMQHYSMTAGWFDGLFYGMLWRYNTSTLGTDFDDSAKMKGFQEPELVYSYDGKEFLYTTGKALVERPAPPNPGCAQLSPIDMCESIDGQSYILNLCGVHFGHGCGMEHFHWLEDNGFRPANLMYKIRKDGFCGLHAVNDGTVVTKGIALIKDDLSFNVNAACGQVRFGLMENDGTYLDGFSPEDCIPVQLTDSVDVRPQWKTRQLSEVLGRKVRLVVQLRNAELHAITATAQPYIIQRQKSFADPQGIFE